MRRRRMRRVFVGGKELGRLEKRMDGWMGSLQSGCCRYPRWRMWGEGVEGNDGIFCVGGDLI